MSSLALVALGACSSGPSMTREELLVPENCQTCHPDHYREWSGSMHAYAADDPVFIAMNQRGQREADLGPFCVNCHAPMAVLEGATTDGLNLDEVPQHLKGVTCYFCHSVDAVEGTHNNPLRLADDGVLRGGLRGPDPIENGAHETTYSPLHDRNARESSDLCGSCHDIVTPRGVHLERTYSEWQESIFGQDVPGHLSCGNCHMQGRRGVAADFDGVPQRTVHEHTFAGLDVALTEWPETEAQRAAIKRDLDPAILPTLCVEPAPGGVDIEARLHNAQVGHMWPSGAAQDRRAWVEIVAYAGDEVIFQSGVIAEGEPVSEAEATDGNLWVLRDRGRDEEGAEAHMFWDVAEIESALLPASVTNDPEDVRFYLSTVVKRYSMIPTPDRITMRVHVRPIGLDVLDDLIATGDLDPAVRARVPTFTLAGTELEWTSEDGFICVQ